MKKNTEIIIKVIIILSIFINISTNIYAEEITNNIENQNIQDQMSKNLDLDSYISQINDYVSDVGMDDINFEDIANSLIKTNKVEYEGLIKKILSFFIKEINGAIKGSVGILLVALIMAILSNLELEKQSDITKIAHLACFAAIATITITTFVDVINSFKNVIGTLTTLMQTISPFLMSVLIATGSITSTGIIQPMILFVASAVGFIVNYVVIPFFTISVALNVICSISENIRLNKMSKLFSSSAIWIVGILLTIFLGIISIETSLTSSVDSLAVKTTQAAVSNFVPVVGKFFSDSFETVVGATKIISNVGGTVGIFSVIIVAIIPILKILCVMIIYMILGALIEMVSSDDTVVKYISSFANVYKNLLGVLIGITILFVISTGIILNLINNIVK